MYPGNKRKKVWREEKVVLESHPMPTFDGNQSLPVAVYFMERLLKMTQEERRKEYLREYVALKDIPTWMEEMNKTQNDGNSGGSPGPNALKKQMSGSVQSEQHFCAERGN
uniref:Uncharacterized protein n=1 Tax=Sphaerodactylus townsendi TaxID=933632 RepID=A0ACB8GEV4_9SAUR